jgi:hypothetical protein
MKGEDKTERTERCMVCHQSIQVDRHGYAKVTFDQLIYFVHRKVCLRLAEKDHPHLVVLDLVVGKEMRSGKLIDTQEENV